MSVKFEKIEPGMTLYDRHRYKMGNTTVRTIGEWTVQVISVDRDKRTALASWNGNSPELYHIRDLECLHTWSMYDKNVAELTKGIFGAVTRVRKLTKAELKARKEAGL